MITEPNLIIEGFNCKCIGVEPSPKEKIDFKKYTGSGRYLYLVPVADAHGNVFYNIYQPQELAEY